MKTIVYSTALKSLQKTYNFKILKMATGMPEADNIFNMQMRKKAWLILY